MGPGESSIDHFKQIIIRLDPDSVFPPTDLARGLTEKTIAQLKVDIADKIQRKESTHNEVMAIHAKFSIPVACLVFAVIALALGLRVARDGKLGGFVVGIGVIFAYYITMFLAESMAKGHRIPAEYARWVPNLLLGPVRYRGARLAGPPCGGSTSLRSAFFEMAPTRVGRLDSQRLCAPLARAPRLGSG